MIFEIKFNTIKYENVFFILFYLTFVWKWEIVMKIIFFCDWRQLSE